MNLSWQGRSSLVGIHKAPKRVTRPQEPTLGLECARPFRTPKQLNSPDAFWAFVESAMNAGISEKNAKRAALKALEEE